MKIKNWRVYQHYKDRNPPWIKLHFALLSSPDWVTLDDASRVLAVACMLIASRDEGQIPNDPDYLRRVAYLNSPPDFRPLIRCGFLELDEDASKLLADASALQADARPETETEKKAEAEAETDPLPSLSSGLSDPTKDIGSAGSTEPPLCELSKDVDRKKKKKPKAKVDPKSLITRTSQRAYWRNHPDCVELLLFWQQTFEMRQIPKPTDKRLDKIHDAYAAGWTFTDLCKCLIGHSQNPWRREHGGRTIELEVLLRPENLEAGLRAFDGEGSEHDMRARNSALLPLRVQWPEIDGWRKLCSRHLLSGVVPEHYRAKVKDLEIQVVMTSTAEGTRKEALALLLSVLVWTFNGRAPEAWAGGWPPDPDFLHIPPEVDDFLARECQGVAAAMTTRLAHEEGLQ